MRFKFTHLSPMVQHTQQWLSPAQYVRVRSVPPPPSPHTFVIPALLTPRKFPLLVVPAPPAHQFAKLASARYRLQFLDPMRQSLPPPSTCLTLPPLRTITAPYLSLAPTLTPRTMWLCQAYSPTLRSLGSRLNITVLWPRASVGPASSATPLPQLMRTF